MLSGGDMPARCLQRCQDQVQESVPSEPSEKDIQKAQVKPAIHSGSLLMASFGLEIFIDGPHLARWKLQCALC